MVWTVLIFRAVVPIPAVLANVEIPAVRAKPAVVANVAIPAV